MYVHQITAAKPLHDPENVVSGHLIVVAGKSEEISKPVLVIKMLVGISDPGSKFVPTGSDGTHIW